ncbi:MAG TPA: PTS sugar transporter subunit IIC [Deltaproteobacteria bacterium]|nr:PTS sugar transporter subunit IIC [Deltaproteobacteria bacterium]HOI06534.1 PTS sugar transporter subunit IIC [Deltaproteobacteria bacterium]
MILSVGLSAVVGALLWLDRVYAFQFMISRPIVIGPVLGLVMGDLSTGLITGAALELLWLNAPPVGAYLPKDESFCAAAVTPAAVIASASLSDASAAGLALLAGLPLSFVGRVLDTHLRKLNQGLIPDDTTDIERTISHAMARALTRSFFFALAALAVSSGLVCTLAFLLAPRLPGPVAAALSFMPSAAVAIGLAGLVSRDMPRPGKAGLFVLGIVLFLVTASWIR